MERRAFLGLAGTAALSPLLLGRASAQDEPAPPPASAPADAPFAPVRVARERVVRTVVGLRPYRRSGFVLRTERAGRKTIVHNYGHGGCGVTLSWGCSALAANLAAGEQRGDAAVIGAGVMGLTTALLMRRLGMDVTIYAEALPPNTTSNIAAAFWFPTTLFDEEHVDPDLLAAFPAIARASQRAFQHYVNDPAYGVYWIRHSDLRGRPPRRMDEALPGGDDLYPGRRLAHDPARQFGYPYAVSYHALMVDPDIYLRALMRDVENAGVRVQIARFDDLSQVMRLRERVVVNCTGLGARALFGDEELEPVRGQLTLLLPQPEIDYGYIARGPGGVLYMFPRRGAIVLGGTHDHGEWSLTPDAAEIDRMLTGHARIAALSNG